ncbi:MAG TPA: hypothetical protein VK601_00565 [Kofleriaceae bacterium]|nr:hypothetical protein [Kofleriaceae bacterium]
MGTVLIRFARLVTIAVVMLAVRSAGAVPSFARQTGCALAVHVPIQRGGSAARADGATTRTAASTAAHREALVMGEGPSAAS